MNTPLRSLLIAGALLLLGPLAAPARADILYVANAGVAVLGTIEKFNALGVGTLFASSGLSSPAGLAFDTAGNLYAANNFGSTIEKFTPSGVGSVFAGVPFQTTHGLNSPMFLAFTDDAGAPLKLANQKAVPEPSTWVLLVSFGVAWLARRRRVQRA